MFFQIILAICVTHSTPRVLPVDSNQHSWLSKNYKYEKLGNKLRGDTEDSTVQGLRDREIDIISKKSLKKNKTKGVQKKKLIDIQCKNNINTIVAKELVSSENIAI